MTESRDKSRASDELEIRGLIARLAHCADEGGIEEYMPLFAEDAVWEIAGSSAARGSAEISKGVLERWSTKMTGPESNTRHVISTTTVTIDGDKASAKSVFQFFSNVHKAPVLVAVGTYEDKFVKSDGRWKFAHRLIHAPEL